MQKTTYSFSVISFSIISLAFSSAFVKACDLTGNHQRNYVTQQATQQLAQKDENSFQRWKNTSLLTIIKIKQVAQAIIELEGGDIPSSYLLQQKQQELNNAVNEYKNFLDDLQAKDYDSVAFLTLRQHAHTNYTRLSGIVYQFNPNYRTLVALGLTQTPIVGNNGNTYYFDII